MCYYLSVLCGTGSASQDDTSFLMALISGLEYFNWCLYPSMSVPLSQVLEIRHTVHSWMCKWIVPLLKLSFIQMTACFEALDSQSHALH